MKNSTLLVFFIRIRMKTTFSSWKIVLINYFLQEKIYLIKDKMYDKLVFISSQHCIFQYHSNGPSFAFWEFLWFFFFFYNVNCTLAVYSSKNLTTTDQYVLNCLRKSLYSELVVWQKLTLHVSKKVFFFFFMLFYFFEEFRNTEAIITSLKHKYTM